MHVGGQGEAGPNLGVGIGEGCEEGKIAPSRCVASACAICGFLRSVEKTNKNSFLLVTQNYYTQDSKLVRDTN